MLKITRAAAAVSSAFDAEEATPPAQSLLSRYLPIRVRQKTHRSCIGVLFLRCILEGFACVFGKVNAMLRKGDPNQTGWAGRAAELAGSAD